MKEAAAPTTPATKNASFWRWALFVALALSLATLGTCSPRRSTVEQIRRSGVLRVAVINSPTVYYLGPAGEPVGFEYDLAKTFAQQLGARLEIVVVDSADAAIAAVRHSSAQMAAASIVASPARGAQARFSKPLLQVAPQLVYRASQPPPRDLGEVRGSLRVVKNSVQDNDLRELQKTRFPQLRWDSTDEESSEELLEEVSDGDLDYTIANSDLLAINLRYYPKLRAGLSIGDPQNIVWAFAADRDDSLLKAANAMLDTLGSGELARIKDRYLGHVDQVDSYGAQFLATHVETRLPRYRKAFEHAGSEYKLDWRMLAAIGYQESHWDPSATSPTGVRGIMQLTNGTADLLDVDNRDDPAQSIAGGAQFFRQLLDQLPDDIPEPDRSWMALAAYNMGIGHLLDACELTRQRGGDPHRWLDVRHTLPLLSKEQWYAKTRHGYARSLQAITYVGNVRTYYDMIVWLTGDRSTPLPEPSTDADEPARRRPVTDENPLNIHSPVL